MSRRRVQRLLVLPCAFINTILLFDKPSSVCSLLYKHENITNLKATCLRGKLRFKFFLVLMYLIT